MEDYVKCFGLLKGMQTSIPLSGRSQLQSSRHDCLKRSQHLGLNAKPFTASTPFIMIRYLYTHLNGYWGKGYGRKLMRVVMSELKEQGFSEVFLWVLEENTRARRFYEMFGFTCTDDYREDIIGGKQLREVRYVYKY